MTWFLRITRFASAHVVKVQDKGNSCGMCSLQMVNFKMKKHIIAAGMTAGAEISQLPVVGGVIGLAIARSAVNDAVRSEGEFYAAYDKYAGTVTNFETTGSQMQYYPSILADLRLGRWECINPGDTGFAQAVIDGTRGGAPVLAGVTWNSGGGHVVVIDEAHQFGGQNYFCVCDPWDGEVRVVPGSPGSRVSYDTSTKPFSVNFWGEGRPGGGPGFFDGELVRRVGN